MNYSNFISYGKYFPCFTDFLQAIGNIAFAIASKLASKHQCQDLDEKHFSLEKTLAGKQLNHAQEHVTLRNRIGYPPMHSCWEYRLSSPPSTTV